MDEVAKLIQAAHEGDDKAREKMVMDNVGLVWSVVRHFSGRGCDLDDLFQIGCIGLLKAIDKFNLDYEVKFSTYAVPMITGEIKRFLRDDGMIKVSRSIKELGIRARAVREKLTNELGREPTIQEMAGRLETSCEEVTVALDAAAEVESLYRTVGNGEDTNICLMDRVLDERRDQEHMMNQMVLKQLLDTLEGKDREIIIRRYFENQTQNEIAKALNVSQVQVSRLEKKILRKLREYLNP